MHNLSLSSIAPLPCLFDYTQRHLWCSIELFAVGFIAYCTGPNREDAVCTHND